MRISEMIDFYKNNYELKLFFKKEVNSLYNYGFMYIYSYLNEVEKFKTTFGDYFPFYITNHDTLLSYLSVDTKNFLTRIRKISLENWYNTSIFPQRNTKIAGVYGELFLDFYLRIVKGLQPIITYASKRSYKSNYESTGIDSIVFDCDKDITFYLCEAKFVASKSNAKSSLLDDINGSKNAESHFNADYINDYFDFVMKKSIESNIVKLKRVFDFIQKVNLKSIDGDKFLDIAINEGVKLHVVLFAIYQDNDNDVDNYDCIYKDLADDLEIKLQSLGIEYTYEIVFIPTNNSSMNLKKGIDSYYE